MKILKTPFPFIIAALILLASTVTESVSARQPQPVDSIISVTDSTTVAAINDTGIEPTSEETPVQQVINQPMHFKTDGLIKILGLIIPFASVIILIWLLLHFRNERERDRLRVIEISLNKGCPLPTEFYTHTTKNSPYGKLQSGICWIGAGVAVIVFFGNVADEVSPIGIIPFFIGIAQLAAYRVQSRKQKQSEKYNIPQPRLPHNDQQD